MAKFAKLLENKAGEQLLVTVIGTDNEGEFGVNHTLEKDDCIIDIKITPLSEQQAYLYVNGFQQETAEEILEDPIKFFS